MFESTVSLKILNYLTSNFLIIVFCFHFAGRKIAIDASMCIYQFLIAVRQEGNMLVNEDGETTRQECL